MQVDVGLAVHVSRRLVPFDDSASMVLMAGKTVTAAVAVTQPITSFAGIWRPIEGGAVFAFLTMELNQLVAPMHPEAMPVLLHVEDEDR